MITQHGNQPIHLNQLLVLEEFLVIFGAVLLQFNKQLAKCSDDGGKITCPVRGCCYGTIWLMLLVSVNTSFSYRNNLEVTFFSATGNDWLLWIHSIIKQLYIVTNLFCCHYIYVEPCVTSSFVCKGLSASLHPHSAPLSASSGRKTERHCYLSSVQLI